MRAHLRLPLALSALIGCADSAPAKIEAPAKLTQADGKLLRIDAKVLNAAGEPLPELHATVSAVSDPALLKLGNNGELQCQRYGTGTATLSAGSVKHDVVIECMLIAEVKATPPTLAATLVPDAAGVVQPAGIGPFTFEVIGLDGQPILGAPLAVTPSDPNIIKVGEGGSVTALRRGKASIKAIIGDKIGTVEVEISEEVAARKAVPLDDSKSFGLPLEPGSYLVTAGSDQGVKVSFEGVKSGDEAGCVAPEGTSAELRCTLAQAGTLQVENPGVLGMGGGAALVNLRVVRLP